MCGIAVGDSRHTAVRGEQEIKKQCQEQPPLIKNALSHAARSYIHTLSLMPGNVFTPHNLTSAYIFCLYCTAKGYTHLYVITHRIALLIHILMHSVFDISGKTSVNTLCAEKGAVTLGFN